MRMGAEQLPRLRLQLVEWESTVLGRACRERDYKEGVPLIRQSWSERQYQALHAASLRQMGLFHVSEDMTELCAAAALSLPAIDRLGAEDFPARHGFLLWSGEPVEVNRLERNGELRDIHAVRWHIHEDGRGAFFWWYENRDGGSLPEGQGPEMRDIIHRTMPALCECIFGERLTFGVSNGDQPVERMEHRYKVLISTFILMSQHISAVSNQAVDRATRRAARRQQIDETQPVKVIQLRRALGKSSSDSSPAAVSWSHRWVVDGHWRNQWYPSRGVNRPVWISPYVKGPDDKPLVVKERVTSLVR